MERYTKFPLITDDLMDFRAIFAQMDAAALIDSRELALLIRTSAKNIAVMKSRGQLPETAFPGRKINRWRVGVVRNWLMDCGSHNSVPIHASVERHPASLDGTRDDGKPRIGRPRKSAEPL
jgi:hypothetical protein